MSSPSYIVGTAQELGATTASHTIVHTYRGGKLLVHFSSTLSPLTATYNGVPLKQLGVTEVVAGLTSSAWYIDGADLPSIVVGNAYNLTITLAASAGAGTMCLEVLGAEPGPPSQFQVHAQASGASATVGDTFSFPNSSFLVQLCRFVTNLGVVTLDDGQTSILSVTTSTHRDIAGKDYQDAVASELNRLTVTVGTPAVAWASLVLVSPPALPDDRQRTLRTPPTPGYRSAA